MAGAFFSNAHEVFYLPPAEPPGIEPAGALNAASFQPVLSPGVLVSLFGRRLSQGQQAAVRLPLPTQMNAVAVKVNGTAVPLLYVGSDQINFHLPFDLPLDPVRLTVTNAGVESAPITVAVAEFSPGIFTLSPSRQGAILISGTGLIARAAGEPRSQPARKGDIVEIYGTGLGRLLEARPGSPPATAETPIVMIGGARAEVLFSGAAPNLTGVYQVNARVPLNATSGDQVPVSLRLSDSGPGRFLSNEVTMAVADSR